MVDALILAARDRRGACVRLLRSQWRRLALCGSLLAPWPASAATALLEEQPLAARSTTTTGKRFTELAPAATGIVAENRYADPRMWGERSREFEVGAIGTGVAIGDYDGDGRPDVFIVSKTESCRLFRNLGDWRFEDVTERAGVGDPGEAAAIWKQGAAFADVNNDGRLDLYVCRFAARNLLYVNQGDGTFREQAEAAGLAVVDASGMAAFSDYDRDGWLDVYVQTNLLNNAEHPNGQRDHLFRNQGNGTFAEVSDAAGIAGESLGHSATWWDFDHDGWPDLYVTNDFATPDRLYRNNRDGTFTDVLDQVVPHTPYSSMGSDLGDVNNDGLVDFYVPDMAATSHEKDLRSMAEVRARAADPLNPALAPQYPRAALYLNTGTGRCLEAAFLAGLDATDWTWSVRLEDLDNDGRVDLHVTNGMHREIHNADLLQRMLAAETQAERIRIARSSPILVERNLAFRNAGDLRFENVAEAWGLDQRGVSFGAAVGDLDGDGDLDLVYTNYQAGPTVLRNDGADGHRLIVKLRGVRSNRFGVGATVRIETADGPQVRSLVLARGYLSTSEPMVHFGLGKQDRIKRLTVEWPTGQVQEFENLAGDRCYTITEAEAPPGAGRDQRAVAPRFAEVSQAVGLSRSVQEATIDETASQPLLPVRLNRRGPALALGDLDGDGVNELVFGATTETPRLVARRTAGGGYQPMPVDGSGGPAAVNDGPLLIFDANGDGKNDLLITRGGAALPVGAPDYAPALWFNQDGRRFTPAPADDLANALFSVGAAAVADYDHDGRPDVFLGGRVRPGEYPVAPPSVLLRNEGGRFVDVTESTAPGLAAVGMVTAVLWSDVDADGWADLVIALEWGGVKYFRNLQGQRFEDQSSPAGFAAAGTGWWSALAAGDFNGDGRMDYAAGNLGLNTQYHATPQHPAVLYYGQFTPDRGPQIVEAYYEGDRLVPWRTRRQLGAAIPSVLKRFPKNDAYARATLPEILGEERLAAAERFAATELRSGVFLSQADGTFRFEPLPSMVQLSPVQALVAADFDLDGHCDLAAVQNSYAPVPAVGRWDGGLGVLLRGDDAGRFTAVPAAESGLVVPGDAQALVATDLDGNGAPDLVVTRNSATSLAFRNRGVPKTAADTLH